MKSKIELNYLLNIPNNIYEKFHNQTVIKSFSFLSHVARIPKRKKQKISFKGYARLKEIVLPRPKLPKKYLLNILSTRISTRNFLNSSLLSLETLSTLFFYSAGLRERKFYFEKRFYPSAGACYPLEVYLISINTQLPKGIYHYYLKNHSFEQLLLFDRFDFKKFFNQDWIERSSCLVVITAVFKRTTLIYGDRGYRHILIEIGHLGQNFYLNSSSLNIACCAVGGFMDRNLNELFDIDGINEAVVYVLALGKSK